MYKIIGADGKQYGPVSIEQMRQWIATSSQPSSCNGKASVQRQMAVPSCWNEMVMFMVLIFDVAVE